MLSFYFRLMQIQVIQCPENGTVFKRQDGLRISIGNYITIFFADNVKLMFKIKTSAGHLAFPLPDDEDLYWFVNGIAKGKFQTRPSTYEYVEAKLIKEEAEYEAFIPWCKEE